MSLVVRPFVVPVHGELFFCVGVVGAIGCKSVLRGHFGVVEGYGAVATAGVLSAKGAGGSECAHCAGVRSEKIYHVVVTRAKCVLDT